MHFKCVMMFIFIRINFCKTIGDFNNCFVLSIWRSEISTVGNVMVILEGNSMTLPYSSPIRSLT